MERSMVMKLCVVRAGRIVFIVCRRHQSIQPTVIRKLNLQKPPFAIGVTIYATWISCQLFVHLKYRSRYRADEIGHNLDRFNNSESDILTDLGTRFRTLHVNNFTQVILRIVGNANQDQVFSKKQSPQKNKKTKIVCRHHLSSPYYCADLL